MDREHNWTDKKIADIERRIKRVFSDDPALLRLEHEYAAYMADVDRKTEKARERFLNAETAAEKRELKAKYRTNVLDLTINNRRYNEIVDRITTEIARLNQKALDIINSELSAVYAENYNAVAKECRRAGIKVNAET